MLVGSLGLAVGMITQSLLSVSIQYLGCADGRRAIRLLCLVDCLELDTEQLHELTNRQYPAVDP